MIYINDVVIFRGDLLRVIDVDRDMILVGNKNGRNVWISESKIMVAHRYINTNTQILKVDLLYEIVEINYNKNMVKIKALDVWPDYIELIAISKLITDKDIKIIDI